MNRERCFCRVTYQNMAESIFLIKIKLINFFQTISFTCFFTEIIIHFKERCIKNLRSLGCHFSVGRNPLATGCKHVPPCLIYTFITYPHKLYIKLKLIFFSTRWNTYGLMAYGRK
jgi:hypothetical protein